MTDKTDHSKLSKPTKLGLPKTGAQNKKIWAMAKELYMEKEVLRDVVEQATGQRSISALSLEGAARVINLLEQYRRGRKLRPSGKGVGTGGVSKGKAGKKPDTGKKTAVKKGTHRKVIFLASIKQRAMIGAMAAQVHWKYTDGFKRFLQTRLKMASIRTNQDVTVVKMALENMINRQKTEG